MPDRFLAAYRVADDRPIFTLANDLLTVSVRDQIVRATMMARRLPKLLATEQGTDWHRQPVVVVGGGICGVTAAVVLARHGYRVRLFQRGEVLFAPQQRASHHRSRQEHDSRWLDLFQYDWPHTHWDRQRFPRRANTVPFSTRANRSDICAEHWQAQLAAHLPSLKGRLSLERSRSVVDCCKTAHGLAAVRVAERNAPAGKWQVAAAVLWATGPGRDRDAIDSSTHRSFRFWTPDPFERPACGLPGRQQEGTVLIAGSGDGGVQDLLRITTRQPSAGHLARELQLDHLVDLRRLPCSEMCALRARSFGPPALVQPYLEQLDETHRSVVKDTLANHPELRKEIERMAASRPDRTILADPNGHLTCLYGLNRFLAWLLLKTIGDGSLELWPATRVKTITTQHRLPSFDAASSLGHPWDVEVEANDGTVRALRANVVVLRTGLHGSPQWHPRRPVMPHPHPPLELLESWTG